MSDPNIVKVITTNDLYDEVLGLRADVKKVLEEHKEIPSRVQKLEDQVADLRRWRSFLTGAAVAAGPLGAALTKWIGG